MISHCLQTWSRGNCSRKQCWRCECLRLASWSVRHNPYWILLLIWELWVLLLESDVCPVAVANDRFACHPSELVGLSRLPFAVSDKLTCGERWDFGCLQCFMKA